MIFSAQRETLLTPLQQVVGAVERRQTSPILGNVLVECSDGILTLTASDSEIEVQATVDLQTQQDGATTLPARKWLDICKHLPETVTIDFKLSDNKATLKSGRSRFSLSTLPALDFPKVDELQEPQIIRIDAESLSWCIRHTAFSMAQQDVRFYLNGMLLEIGSQRLSSVATDGHRLAYAQSTIEAEPETPVRAIVPRKSVSELLRLLNAVDTETEVTMAFTPQHLQVQVGSVRMTTKLVDGRFPDYNRVIPIDGDKELVVDKTSLKQCLNRASVLSNEKYRGVRVALSKDLLTISSQNPEQEEAIDELEIEYNGEATEIGFNVTYLLDVLNTVESDLVRLIVKNGDSSALLIPQDQSQCDLKYVVMPMRL